MTKKKKESSAVPEGTQTIKVAGKFYGIESMTKHANGILGDLQKVDGLIGQQQLALSVSQLGKGKLLEELEKEALANFVEVPEPAPEETPEETPNA